MKKQAKHFRAGFSLVEVTLALGVAGFCLVALVGLLPVGVNSNQLSLQQTAAASIAASIVADLRATPAGGAAVASPLFAVPVPALSTEPLKHTLYLHDDGTVAAASGTTPSATVDADADPAQSPRYRVTLYFVPPAATKRYATTVRVLITWPALADPKAAQNPAKFSGSWETCTALDRQ